MSKTAKPKPIGKDRAAAIRSEIDKLTGGASSSEQKEQAPSSSPRDFIQRWMAEHDKKPEKK